MERDYLGLTAVFKCKNCGLRFESSQGDGFNFVMYRCVDCDALKTVKRDPRESILRKLQETEKLPLSDFPDKRDFRVCFINENPLVLYVTSDAVLVGITTKRPFCPVIYLHSKTEAEQFASELSTETGIEVIHFPHSRAALTSSEVSAEITRRIPKEEIGACEKCGGRMSHDIDLAPMCPKCHSRKVDAQKILVSYD